MYFYTDEKNKLVWGWSAKCGCSHIKNLILNYQNIDSKEIHTNRFINGLPDNIENYDLIIVMRNPFKRIVSGFTDKFSSKGELRFYYTDDHLTFSVFVDFILNNNFEDYLLSPLKHHFIPQTEEQFSVM